MLAAAALLLGAGLWASAAEARRIYVDQNGVGGTCSETRDWATAQNPATPVCSIEKGITLAQTGDTVMVRGGRYLRSGPLGINKSNFALMAYPGEHVRWISRRPPPATASTTARTTCFSRASRSPMLPRSA
jgi:hypothetical protein